MSDDLSAFFAKKKDKKKKNVVKLDEVGNLLEKKVKKQEERDRAEAEDQKPGDEDRSPEESEWLDYESNTNNKVEGLRIKDMAIEEEAEEVKETTEEKEKVEKESGKTWGTIEKQEAAPEQIPSAAEYKASKPDRYVPPSMRAASAWGAGGGHGGPAAKIDINNQEMFPTFAAAEQIEKHKKDEQKNAWTVAGAKESTPSSGPQRTPGAYVPPRGDAWGSGSGGPSAARSSQDREAAMAAARAIAQTGPTGPTGAPAMKPPPPSVPELKKSANAYVPPHQRNNN